MEIYVDILDAVSNANVGPTRIMYKANISWQVLQESLDLLQSNGFLLEEIESARRVYRLTEKGFKVLGDFRRAQDELVVSKPVIQ